MHYYDESGGTGFTQEATPGATVESNAILNTPENQTLIKLGEDNDNDHLILKRNEDGTYVLTALKDAEEDGEDEGEEEEKICVMSLNGATGAVSIIGGKGIRVETSGKTIKITADSEKTEEDEDPNEEEKDPCAHPEGGGEVAAEPDVPTVGDGEVDSGGGSDWVVAGDDAEIGVSDCCD